MKETFQEELLAAEASQRERDLTIQKLQATVASNEQVLATIKEDLQKTTNERNHFQTQHKTLLDRVSNMKSTLGTKLQADMVTHSIFLTMVLTRPCCACDIPSTEPFFLLTDRITSTLCDSRLINSQRRTTTTY
jgi:hypothetical protein